MYYKEKEDGAIEAWTEFAVEPLGETPDELREDIRFFMKAFQKPILEEQAKDEKPILVADDNSQQINEGHFLFSNNFYKCPFASSAVKLSIKYLFPGSKVEFTVGDCNNNFTSHYLPFHVGICIILPNIVSIV